MSLTYTSNDTPPVAKITGDSSRLVYIDEEEAKEKPRKDSILDNTGLEIDVINIIADALGNGNSFNNVADLLLSLNQEEEEDEDLVGESIYLDEGEIIEVVPSVENERVIIGGMTGSGKSYFAAKYCEIWQRMFPDRTIHIFCRQSDDPAFDNIEHEEIVVDDSILDKDLGIHDFQDALVIMDDLDNLQDKGQITYMHKLLNDLMSCGRKQNIYVMYMTHLFLNRNKTQIPLNEANKIVFFNGVGDRQNMKVLTEYCQMSVPEARELTSLKSRWCCLERGRPRRVIHEKGIFLL